MPVISGRDWGVSVENVSSLAPHIPIQKKQAPAPEEPPVYAPLALDPVYKNANTRIITEDEVLGFIGTVSAIVEGRILRASKLEDTHPYFAYLTEAGAAVVRNGAAHYLVAAAFPINASTNSGDSYAEVLRLRFEEGLDELKRALDEAIGDGIDDGTITPGRMYGIASRMPPARFPDCKVF